VGGSRIRGIIISYGNTEEFVWGKSFWTRGYFAETIGSKTERVVKEYIKNNKD